MDAHTPGGKFNPLESLANLRHVLANMAASICRSKPAPRSPSCRPTTCPACSKDCWGRKPAATISTDGTSIPRSMCWAASQAAIEGTASRLLHRQRHECDLVGRAAMLRAGRSYRGVRRFVRRHVRPVSRFSARQNLIRTTLANISNLAAVRAAFTDRTKLLYVESISNPTLVVANIPSRSNCPSPRG